MFLSFSEVSNQILTLIRRDNETLQAAMVDMRDDIRRLNTITGESSGWADVLLEGDLSRPVVTVEKGEKTNAEFSCIQYSTIIFVSE